MTGKANLKRDQAKALEDLENFIYKSLPIVEELEVDVLGGDRIKGVKINGDVIVGLELLHQWLTTFPEPIKQLVFLKKLWLEGNKFQALPDFIGNLTSLQDLDLSRNTLTTLPESIGNLTSLKKLFLSFNHLTTLPESIGNLRSLEILSINFNELKMLPESIKNLKSLKKLYINNNQLDSNIKILLQQLKKNGVNIER
ncbi:MAG: leucine-rich repeat domain-containing protein [Promethearchaeota archaeon]